MNSVTKRYYVSALMASTLMLSACSDDDDDNPIVVEPTPVTYGYEVTVTNLTHAQPLSPVAMALHDAGISWWRVGEAASDALATLAESGDNSTLLGDAQLLASVGGDGVLPPGESVTLALSVDDNDAAQLSVATMLVNTNDGFTGVTAIDLSMLAVNDSKVILSHVYDAGTEENSELMGTIPGPADGGEGNSEGRETHDLVTLHPGVVTADDGLTESVLTAIHKFDNPSLRISVTRVE